VPTSAARREPRRSPSRTARQSAAPRRTYVLDTSVLLADPAAAGRFAEHRVVLPLVVITELEAKRHHPELGYFARQALRFLDDLRVEHGRLDADLPVGDQGGSIRVELNHSDPSVLPAGFRLGDNDTRILSVASSLASEGDDVVLVSKDLPLRVKAAAVGLTAQEYRAELPPDSGWTGMAELDATPAEISELYDTGRLDHRAQDRDDVAVRLQGHHVGPGLRQGQGQGPEPGPDLEDLVTGGEPGQAGDPTHRVGVGDEVLAQGPAGPQPVRRQQLGDVGAGMGHQEIVTSTTPWLRSAICSKPEGDMSTTRG